MPGQHRNNFDFLRLLFATLVILTHSVTLSGGEADLLHTLTKGQLDFSYLGVRGFFVISGFLVFKSMQRSAGFMDYASKRLLRILPGLIVCILLCMLLLGPLVTTLSIKDYFTARQTWLFVPASLKIPVGDDMLPGVFAENPVPGAVNGSLWTIWFELLFYAVLGILLFIRRSKKLLAIITGLFFAAGLCGRWFFDAQLEHIPMPGSGFAMDVMADLQCYFFGGSLLALYIHHIQRWRKQLFTIVLALTIITLAFGIFVPVRLIFIPLLVICFGLDYLPALAGVRRFGEPSFGIYVYAFPIQQAIVSFCHPSAGMLTVMSLPLACALGYASWHFVDRRFLLLKHT